MLALPLRPAWRPHSRPLHRALVPHAQQPLLARRRLRAVARELPVERRAPLTPNARRGLGRVDAPRRLDRLLDLRLRRRGGAGGAVGAVRGGAEAVQRALEALCAAALDLVEARLFDALQRAAGVPQQPLSVPPWPAGSHSCDFVR